MLVLSRCRFVLRGASIPRDRFHEVKFTYITFHEANLRTIDIWSTWRISPSECWGQFHEVNSRRPWPPSLAARTAMSFVTYTTRVVHGRKAVLHPRQVEDHVREVDSLVAVHLERVRFEVVLGAGGLHNRVDGGLWRSDV